MCASVKQRGLPSFDLQQAIRQQQVDRCHFRSIPRGGCLSSNTHAINSRTIRGRAGAFCGLSVKLQSVSKNICFIARGKTQSHGVSGSQRECNW
jgi:hypothetical protein